MADLEKLVNDICREMYDEAEPGLDWDDLRENPEKYPDDWYQRHYLPREREQEIIDKHCEGENLTDREHSHLILQVVVSYGPSYPPEE